MRTYYIWYDYREQRAMAASRDPLGHDTETIRAKSIAEAFEKSRRRFNGEAVHESLCDDGMHPSDAADVAGGV